MAGPTVEELLRAGGQRRAPPKPPEVGAGETFVNRAVGMIPGANRLTDAIAAMALEAGSNGGARATLTPAARAELQAMGEEVPEEPGLVDRYREVRDRRAVRTEAGSEQNPWAGRAGALAGFGLSLFAPLPKASGAGVGAAAKTGAGYGAFHGLTEGEADLTRGELGQAALDALGGAALGGAVGAGFHGAMRLGQRAKQGLTNARQDVLAQETLAAREAAEEGQAALQKEVGKHRELVGKARGMMEKDFAKREAQHGQALEMNKAKDASSTRSAERAQRVLERARRREVPPEDPNTVVLEGMAGKAHQAQQSRSDKALQYRREMGEPDLPTQVASAREEYIQRMPEALDDPAAARRLFIERYLRQRYPNEPERVERLMRERIGPGGEVLPRPAPATAPAQLGPGQEQVPLLSPLEAAPAARQLPSPLAPPPAIREGATGMPYGQNLRPEPGPTVAASPARAAPEPSMATPRDAPLSQEATRAVSVPNIQRTPQAAPTPSVEAPAAPARPELPAGTTADEVQDVTRLVGPEDVAPLASERAAERLRWMGPRGVLASSGREVMDGFRSSNNVLGSVLGGGVALTRSMLGDPAVRAKVLAAARLHVLAQINPSLAARVAAQLQSSGQNQRAAEHLLARKDPEYREAQQKAAERVSAMSDQQLIELFAQANSPN